MLDTATLRLTFGVVALAVLVLFYTATYRSTRSAYCGWWCVSLACFVVGAVLFLLDGTSLQVVANPSGNALTSAGSAAVWAGARALRDLRTRPSLVVAGPALVLLASFVDDPVHDVWTGGAVFLSGMSTLIGLASRELWAHRAETRASRADDPLYLGSVTAMAVISCALAVYYLVRAAVFVAVGPTDELFQTAFGSQATTLITLVMLVVVTYTMASLSHQLQTTELRDRATRDGLTGLLNRHELVLRIEQALVDDAEAAAMAVLVADLDGFKQLNDRLGHAAGDRALAVFAGVAEAALDAGDSVGRLGGDEFVIVLREGHRAEAVAARIRRELARELGPAAPTVSVGIASGAPGAAAGDVLHLADVALYRAKAEGRDRAVRHTDAAPSAESADRRAVRRA